MPYRLLLALMAAVLCCRAAELEDSVYVYDVFREGGDCAAAVERLKPLPLRPTVILSIEQGPEFVLDRADGDAQLACVIKHLQGQSRSVKALLLQDPVFLGRGEEAIRRATLVRAFSERHKNAFSGAQVDIEPYTIERWSCATIDERRAQMRELHELLKRLRRELGPVALGVVIPWWYPIVKEIPEASPSALFQYAQEIYLMAYGDEGGPILGGTAERILQRIDAPEFFTGNGRLIVALATYEFAGPEQLQADAERLRTRLRSRPNFAGTAIFQAAIPYNAPLVRLVEGTVVDAAGRGIAEVEVAVNGVRGTTNICGQFSLRGISSPTGNIAFQKKGFQPKSVKVEFAAPGRIKEVGKITLDAAAEK